MTLNTQKAEFTRSAAKIQDCPRDGRPQIAFAGRSNVGKSSVINRLLQRKHFVRVSASPGKTVQINYFLVDEKVYLVDLPGYGYAKVSQTEKERWASLIQSWFDDRTLMTLGVLVVDARHKPTAQDVAMAEYYRASGKPWVVAANKMDKLKKSEIAPNLALIRDTLRISEGDMIPFSAVTGMGRETLLERLTAHGEEVSP